MPSTSSGNGPLQAPGNFRSIAELVEANELLGSTIGVSVAELTHGNELLGLTIGASVAELVEATGATEATDARGNCV
ncbi:MAG TPA: hypothetical protein VK588_06805 [Chitinophagaceae bacterium]|nr:hypothetical protein [Chitinophagaceae bacterium]